MAYNLPGLGADYANEGGSKSSVGSAAAKLPLIVALLGPPETTGNKIYNPISSNGESIFDGAEYEGNSDWMNQTIGDAVTKNVSWAMAIAPLVKREGNVNIEWTETNLGNAILARVAPGSMSPLLTATQITHHARMTKRGLGFVIEDSFLDTDHGMRSLANSIVALRAATYRTTHLHTMAAIFDSVDTQMANKQVRVSFQQALGYEADIWGACQKEPGSVGFNTAVDKARSKNTGAPPDVLIVPDRYASMAIPQAATGTPLARYSFAAPTTDGSIVIREGPVPDGLYAGKIAVFASPSVPVDGYSQPLDASAFVSVTGTFHEMRNYSCNERANPKYESSHMDIGILNMGERQLRRISLMKAFDNCMRFEGNDPARQHQWIADHLNGRETDGAKSISQRMKNALDYRKNSGKVADLFVSKYGVGAYRVVECIGQMEEGAISSKTIVSYARTISEKRTGGRLLPLPAPVAIGPPSVIPADRLKNIADLVGTSGAVYDAAVQYCSVPVTMGALRTMIANDIPVPFSFILARPGIVHTMKSAALLRGGLATLVNFWGRANFGFEGSAVPKTHVGHWTIHTATVVHEPKNISILRGCFIDQYHAGQGIEFVKSPSEYSPREAIELIGDNGNINKDIISIMEGADYEEARESTLKNFIDITGFPATTDAVYMPGARRDADYQSAPFTSLIFDFEGVIGTSNTIAFERNNQRTVQNTLCAQGHTAFYDAHSDKPFGGVKEDQGHLGRKGNSPAAAHVRNGGPGFFPEVNWATIPVLG